jgi:hypothetical protein
MSALVDRVTVIYSDRDNLEVSGAGQWLQVPDEWFYGRKFKAILDHFAGTILQAGSAASPGVPSAAVSGRADAAPLSD